MGSFEGMVNTSREVDGNMKWQKMEDSTSQMQEYMNHSADFQRRLVSVRESRALLEKNHRMRKERVSHMGFQFKQILWQMRRAQEDAYLAQERYLKLLQLGGHDLRYQNGNAKVAAAEENDVHVNRVVQQSGCQANQVTSHQNEHQKITGSSQHVPHCKSEPLKDQDTPFVHHHCAEDLADLDLIQGIRFRFYTTVEENNDSVGRNNGDAHEIQSYLTMGNNTELSTEGRPMNFCGQESKGELESIPPPKLSDDFASTSVFVCSNLDSQNFFLEQKSIVIEYNEKQGQDGGKSISLVKESTCEGNKMRNYELDLPVSIMPISPMMKTSTTWNTEWREDLAKDMDKSSSEDAGKSLLKIQKNDFLSQRISKELEDFTKNSSLACCVSKPTTIEDARINKDVGPFKADSTPDKKNVKSTDDIVKSKTTEGQVEETRLTMEEKRKIMKAWHPNEKLEVLATITNTMFLWDIQHNSNQEQHYGSWAECEPMISVALAARGSQQELFDFLETVTGTMSRPMLCCGAVCELLKVYPPEKLVPFRFIEDFFASEPKESKDQRVMKELTFDHLKVYQEEEHTKVWQMLVHHAVSVKDHKLASLRKIAQVFVEILLPSTRTKSFPTEKIKDMHQDLVEFFVTGFKSKTIHLVHVQNDNDKCPVAMKRLQHMSKITGEDHGSEIQSQTGSQIKQTGFCDRETKGFSTSHRSRRSGHLRPVSSRKGLFSCFGSVMRTKFRIWRLKALSRGVDTIDDAVVCMLRNKTQESLHP